MLHIVTALHETLDIFNSNITFAPGIVELNKLISASANICISLLYRYTRHCKTRDIIWIETTKNEKSIYVQC